MPRGGVLVLLVTVVLAPLAAAQNNSTSQDPSVNESDFNTTADQPDDTYLNDSNGTSTDPTVSDSDLDTSVPSPDESYLGDGATTTTPGSAGSSEAGARAAPGFEPWVLLVGLGLVAVALRRVR